MEIDVSKTILNYKTYHLLFTVVAYFKLQIMQGRQASSCQFLLTTNPTNYYNSCAVISSSIKVYNLFYTNFILLEQFSSLIFSKIQNPLSSRKISLLYLRYSQAFCCLHKQNYQKMKNSTEVTFSRQNTQTQYECKRRVMSFLQSALKEQSQKREQAESQLLQYRQRSLRIQSEFSRLIEKYDNHVAVINGRLSYSQQIWNKLIKEIQNFNSNSEMMLQKRCGEITSMMNRRVGEILERTDLEIKKNKKFSEEEFKTIREEIREVLTLAREIDSENQQVKRENQQLHFKVNILREERTLLVQELAQKKMLLKKLAQCTFEGQTVAAVESPRRGRSRLISKGHQQTPIPKFMCEPSLKNISSLAENPESNRASSFSKDKKQQKPGAMTENHLKLVIEREKRKNKELKNSLVKAQNKCVEVNLFLEKVLKEASQEQKAGTMVHLLSAIKVKLTAAESAYHPNLSQTELHQLEMF